MLAGSVLPGFPAAASVRQHAATWTPEVISAKSTVRQLVPCGGLMYAVGSFSEIRKGPHTYVRHDAFSFDVRTGVVTDWNPDVHGAVASIALSPDCGVAYLGGVYDEVHGRRARNIDAVNTTTGRPIRGFAHTADGAVETVVTVKAAASYSWAARSHTSTRRTVATSSRWSPGRAG